MSTDSARIVLVGHCGPDMFMLKQTVGRFAPGASIASVNDAGALEAHLEPGAVLLVNRVLDGRFADERGVELIRTLAARPGAPALILISNHDDAQQDAVEAGARPGFGKSQLYDEATRAILEAALGVD